MTEEKKKQLRRAALEVRIGILKGTHAGKSGHPGGSLSIADILTYLYTCEIRVDPENPSLPDRDRFVLSKGHCAPALYAVLALRGFFPKEELLTLRHLNSRLQGHPDMNKTPGVDMSTGSLGQGISAACGMAMAAKTEKSDRRVYAVIGDGECEEGQVWEAAMFAAHYRLDNLCVILDNNDLQIDGRIQDVIGPDPFDVKFEAFGWNVIKINGHDYDEIEAAINKAKTVKGRPTIIIAKTTKGKGVAFMENKAEWHGVAPNDEELARAISEVTAAAEGGI